METGHYPLVTSVVFSACLLSLACIPAAAELATDGAGIIPFRKEAGIIHVDGFVNGQGPFRLIVDTGASETVLIPRVAAQLGIRTSPVSARQSKGTAETLRVGAAEVKRLQVYVFDPPQAIPLRLNNGLDYHGLLGATFLSRYIVSIDYGRSSMRLDQPGKTPLRGAQAPLARFEVRDGLVYVNGSINGRSPVRFLLDTGSAEILLRPGASDALQLVRDPLPGYSGSWVSRLGQVAVGGAVVSNIDAVIHELPPDPVRRLPYDGILGTPFLSRFRVTINYPGKEVSFVGVQ